jgi:hypothetical protein
MQTIDTARGLPDGIPYDFLPCIAREESVAINVALDRYLRLLHGKGSAVDAMVFAMVPERVAAEGRPRFDHGEAAVVISAITDVCWEKARTFVYVEFVALVRGGAVDCDPDEAVAMAYEDTLADIGVLAARAA